MPGRKSRAAGSLVPAALLWLLAAPLTAQPEIVEGVRVHGNYATSSEEVQAIAGVTIGEPVPDLKLVESRLLESGKFESVEIRKRYRSLRPGAGVHLILVVKETTPIRKRLSFFPVVRFEDEYGFTFGGRMAFLELPRAGDRISFPLTWGGRRVAAAEAAVLLPRLDLLEAGGRISQKENPHFELDDRRSELWAGLRKRFRPFQVSFQTGWTDVDFGPTKERFATLGAGFVFDTRSERNLPRNALYASIDWERLFMQGDRAGPDLDRIQLDLRGFLGLRRASLGGQFLFKAASGRLPDYERPFLGGAATLRGYEAGAFIGDNLVTASLELRVPLGRGGRAIGTSGLLLFLDTGTVYDDGESLRDSRFRQGVGLGGFVSVLGVALKLDLAHDLNGNFRLHFTTGFRF